MSEFHKLSTAKYFDQVLDAENKATFRQKKREASQAFTQVLLLLSIFVVTFYIVQQMPNWLPFITGQ
ncbi:MAG: hypothetical protein ACI87E_004718 [Mariniblastus sp.]|jgi:preprotein translocase subunit SecE